MTKLLKPAIAGAVLLCLACGGNKAAPKPVAGVPGEAFAPLTETDVARFARALPAVVSYLHMRGGPEGQLRVRDDAGKVLAHGIEWVAQAEGVDSVFAANGTDWKFFRAMLYRVSVCAWAVGMENEGQGEAMKRVVRSQPNRSMAGQLRSRIKQMKAVVAAVPEANIEMFRRHYQDLKDFFFIVEEEE
jgi:hypothetical protein